jgi:hypothetical protein
MGIPKPDLNVELLHRETRLIVINETTMKTTADARHNAGLDLSRAECRIGISYTE